MHARVLVAKQKACTQYEKLNFLNEKLLILLTIFKKESNF